MNSVIDHLRGILHQRTDAELTDGQLLDRFIATREEAAFATLVRRHGPMVLGVCRRLLRNPHDAEDAFQATFLVLVKKASSIVPRQMVGCWLHGVASNTALKAQAAAGKRRLRERQMIEMPDIEATEQDGFCDLRPILDQELSRLPDQYRAPIVLCDLEGKTRREAAHQLGWPEGTVSGRLSRARALLARRLTQQGVAVSAGSLALMLAQYTASASVPASLAVSTINAASLVAAGQAAAVAFSAEVVALAEGVMRTMLLTRLKLGAVLLLATAVLIGGAGVATHQALAEPQKEARPGARPERKAEAPASVAGRVVAVAKDGKSITLELPSQNRGEDGQKVEIKLTAKTRIVFDSVGPDGAKLAEGQSARVAFEEGSKDTAASGQFYGTEQDKPDAAGRIVGAAKDGKAITLELPSQVRGEEGKKVEIKLTDRTRLFYYDVGPDGAKLTTDQAAQVWLDRRAKETATKVMVHGQTGRGERTRPNAGGRVTEVSKDGKTITLETPSTVRGGEPGKAEIKLTDSTTVVYSGVKADGAKPTVGYFANVSLQEGSKDTAGQVTFSGNTRDMPDVAGRLVEVAKDGKTITLEVASQVRGEEGKKVEIKFNDQTRIIYSGVVPGGAKPTEGYFVQVWHDGEAKDIAARMFLSAASGRR